MHLRDQDTGRCDTTRAPISVEQVKDWCTHPDTQVTIRRSRTSTTTSESTSTKSPTGSTDQVTERDGTCVHPWCTRPAPPATRTTASPTTAGGPTSSDNIAPLCRRHHRTKTHGRWRYRFLRPGHYLWTSPTGLTYYRDGTGTVDLGRFTRAGLTGSSPCPPRRLVARSIISCTPGTRESSAAAMKMHA